MIESKDIMPSQNALLERCAARGMKGMENLIDHNKRRQVRFDKIMRILSKRWSDAGKAEEIMMQVYDDHSALSRI